MIGAVKLFVLPVLLWAVATVLVPGVALPVLLLSGVSTGVTAPFIATLLGTSPNRMLQVTVLTSALVPFTLPGLVSLLLGQRLEIPYSHMARLLAVIMLPPGILVFLLKRYAPRFVHPMEGSRYPWGCPCSSSSTFPSSRPSPGRSPAISPRPGLAGPCHHSDRDIRSQRPRHLRLWPRRVDGLSGALGLTCINNVLVAVFAARFFGPDPTLLAVMYMFPYFLILFPCGGWRGG